MTTSALSSAGQVLISRRELTATEGPDILVRRVVSRATTSLELMVETAERGRTVDGWLSPDGLVWHVRGDQDTARSAVVAPPPHLAATVARMVALGPRADVADDVVVSLEALRTQLAGGPGALPGTILRIWSLSWSNGREEGGLTVVDQGHGAGLWAVADASDAGVRLRPVTPLEVWTRLASVVRATGQATATS